MLAPRDKLWSTPDEVITKAIELLTIRPDDIVYDIGAGDGRFLFRVMESSPNQCIGVEISSERVDAIQRRIDESGWGERCSVILGNALEQDYSTATAVFLYLVPRGLRLILPLLKSIPHTVRVVTYMSPLPVSETPIAAIKVSASKHAGSEWPLYLYELNSTSDSRAQIVSNPGSVIARRVRGLGNCAALTILSTNGSKELHLVEDSGQVDGLGGVAWDGALVTARFLESVGGCTGRVVEVGCGAGVLGLMLAAFTSTSVTLTDQTIDLATLNAHNCVSAMPVLPKQAQLAWGCVAHEEALLSECGALVDVLIGCEVACLQGQQEKLVQSISRLLSPTGVALISFDGSALSSTKAEEAMDKRMAALGFLKRTVAQGRVIWHNDGSIVGSSVAIYSDGCSVVGEYLRFVKHASKCDEKCRFVCDSEGTGEDGMHHISEYYRHSPHVI